MSVPAASRADIGVGAPPEAPLRPPCEVMALPRLGSIHPCRLSFARTLLRRMARERWRIERERFAMDERGVGHAVYAVHTPGGRFSFVAFGDHLAPEERTDRVIATRWDASFALLRGPADDATVARLAPEVPRQEAGRVGPAELVLSRANRSVRLFEHVVDRLASGRQPEARELARIGYLMRTTAVYGNGKFGLGDLEAVARGGVFGAPFQAEMLTVYLARHLSFDLVNHMAATRAPGRAATLDPALARGLGVGNATGLGMAPFLIAHPKLLDRWMLVRERALARVRARPRARPDQGARMLALIGRARRHVAQWCTDDARQGARLAVLAQELATLEAAWAQRGEALLRGERPFARLLEGLDPGASLELRELLVSLLLEINGDLVDDLEAGAGDDEHEAVDPRMQLGTLIALLERDYDWALAFDFTRAEATARFWYVSEEKEEPRLGERGVDEGDSREMRIDVARQVQGLHRALLDVAPCERGQPVGRWLLDAPAWRGVVARVQSLAGLAYAEVRANLLAADTVPVDLLRCKLATFGAGRFDPKSDRWTRITLFQGAPLADDIDAVTADDWWLPVAPV